MNALKLTSRSTSTTAQPRILDLAPNLQIEIDQVFGHQIAGFGLPGTGKTTFGVRLCEQIGRYPVPMVIFDREGDWLPIADILSRGMIATSTNCPTGYDVLGGGLQVVYDLSSWGDEEAAAAMMCTIVGQLMQWAEALPTHDRVPCLVVLDEAHHWLPQRRGSYLTPDTFRQLFDAFQAVGSTGRKRGLTPAYFCPKISELSKRVLYPGLLAFFRASLDTDLKRYLEHLHCSDLSNDELKARISRFGRGKAIVTLPTGAQQIVTFHNRQSQHVSHTPTVQAAINRYGSLPFDRQASYGTFIASRDEAAMTSISRTTPCAVCGKDQMGKPLGASSQQLDGSQLVLCRLCNLTSTIEQGQIVPRMTTVHSGQALVEAQMAHLLQQHREVQV